MLRSRHALRIPQAAEYIGATNWFVEELVRNGEIPFRDYGKYRTLDADDLDAWVQRQPKKRMKGNAIQVAA
jgi:excisionase family DNA binding protein